MASSVTQICNLALAKLGQKRIESTSEASKEAQWASELYPHARDFVTEAGLWRHARKILALEEATNDREDDYEYAYTYPSDCLAFKYILPETGVFDPGFPIRYECIDTLIYSDERLARGLYVRQVTDVTKFKPSFAECVSWYLGYYLVQPLRLENKFMGEMLTGYDRALSHAIRCNDMEEMRIKTADEAMADWHLGR